MNTITIDNNTKKLTIKEDTNLIYDNCNTKIEIEVFNEIKIFEYIKNSNIKSTFNIKENTTLNRFSIYSSIDTEININKKDVSLEYYYSTINETDNRYIININHNYENTISKVINHGININNSKLDFIVNGVVKKDSSNVICNQDSKIIVMAENNSSIKPNLIINNNDITANHSAYIGYFNKETMFYLNSRGINDKDAQKLLAKSFLIGNMNISYIEKDIILQNIDNYWR